MTRLCAFLFLLQVCNKREKRLSDPILEKYIINVVFDTINAFFSSPFSENSTSLQVRTEMHCGDEVFVDLLRVGSDTL